MGTLTPASVKHRLSISAGVARASELLCLSLPIAIYGVRRDAQLIIKRGGAQGGTNPAADALICNNSVAGFALDRVAERGHPGRGALERIGTGGREHRSGLRGDAGGKQEGGQDSAHGFLLGSGSHLTYTDGASGESYTRGQFVTPGGKDGAA